MDFGGADFDLVLKWIGRALVELQRFHDPLRKRFEAFGDVAGCRCIARLIGWSAIYIRIVGEIDVEVLFDRRDILLRIDGLCVVRRIETLFGGRDGRGQGVSGENQQFGAFLRDVAGNLSKAN